MKKERKYIITKQLLKQYYTTALQNARELITEATTLSLHKHYARAYFLACSSIEESGKAMQAYLGLGRNLENPAVNTALKKSFEDHDQKNLLGLASILLKTEMKKEDLDFIIDTSIKLLYGREKALYVDILDDGRVTIPKAVVPEKNAKDTINLAEHIYNFTQEYITTKNVKRFTSFEDKHFAIPTEKIVKMLNVEDFWEYYIDQLSRNRQADFIEHCVRYWDEYYCRKRTYSHGY